MRETDTALGLGDGLLPAGELACLSEPMRRFHFATAPVRAAGDVDTRPGRGALARAAARWLGLPPELDDARLLVWVVPGSGSLRVERRFGDAWTLVSVQRAHGGQLRERWGVIELRLRLHVAEGALIVRTAGWALCLGDERVPLPRVLGPHVIARAEWVEETGHIVTSVAIDGPLGNRLLSYRARVALADLP